MATVDHKTKVFCKFFHTLWFLFGTSIIQAYTIKGTLTAAHQTTQAMRSTLHLGNAMVIHN